jgi:hypothetical protein
VIVADDQCTTSEENWKVWKGIRVPSKNTRRHEEVTTSSLGRNAEYNLHMLFQEDLSGRCNTMPVSVILSHCVVQRF